MESLEEVEIYPNEPVAAFDGYEQQSQGQLDTNLPPNKIEQTVSQTSVLYSNDETEATNISGSIIASQPLLRPEVEFKEEIAGDEPDPNELAKVEAGLTMVWNEFERIAEERRKGNLWDMEGVQEYHP